MAHFDEIPSDFMPRVVRELAEFIDRGQRAGERAQQTLETTGAIQMAESLTVWKLNGAAFQAFAESELEGDVVKWTEQTPFLHHQIRLRGRAEGFARSLLKVGTEQRAICQVSVSAVASRLSELFKMIDDNKERDPVVKADPVVRLLEIPAFQLLALWLFAEKEGQSRIVIVHAPERYEELAQPGFLDSETFFGSLKRVGPILDVI